MNIAGVVVRARPSLVTQVEALLNAMVGVEVHAHTEDGRLVVTIEEESDRGLADIMVGFHDLPGVLSAAMIYHEYSTDEDAA